MWCYCGCWVWILRALAQFKRGERSLDCSKTLKIGIWKFKIPHHSYHMLRVCVCVCVCVCLGVNHYNIIRWSIKVDEGLPCVRHYIPGQVEATLRTLSVSQRLFLLWSSKQDIRRASKGDLVLRGGSLGRSDLGMDHVDWGIAWERGDSQNVDEQEERHLFYCWFPSYLGKLFDVGKSRQLVCVMVERHELFH